MRKFIISFAILIFAILGLFSSVAFCDDRYQYLGKSSYDTFYLDITTVVKKYTTLPIFKFWIKNVVSEARKNYYIATQENYERKNLLQNLSYVLYCDEINLSENTYHDIEVLYYSNEGLLFRDDIYMSWRNIPPNSFIESARDVIKRMPQNKFIKGIENEVENNKNSYNYTYIFISLLAGVAISALLVVFIKKFMPDNNEKNINSSSKAKTENDVIDAILVDENPIFVSKNEVRETEVRETIDEHSRETFLSKITLIEKIFICLALLNILLIFLTLSGFLQPLEGMSIQQSKGIIKSSFLMLCAWFSVRYSFIWQVK